MIYGSSVYFFIKGEKMKKISVGAKVAIGVAVLQLLVFTILIWRLQYSLSESLTKNSIQNMRVIAKDRAELVESYIDECATYLDGFASSDIVVNACVTPNNVDVIDRAQHFTDEYAKNLECVEGLYVALPDTYVLTHTNPDSVDKVFRTGDSLAALQNSIKAHDRAFCTGIVTAPVTRAQVIPLYRAIYDNNGIFVGFVGVAFFTDGLKARLERVSETDVDSAKYSLINTSSLVYIFDGMSQLDGMECGNPAILSLAKKIKESKDDFFFEETLFSRVYSGYYMKDRDWLFIVSNSEGVILSTVTAMKNELLKIGILVGALLTLLSIIGVRLIMRPLKNIEKSIVRLRKNDFSENGFTRYVRRTDEYGSFARAVELLKDALENQNEIYSELLKVQSIGFISIAYDSDEIILINKEALSMLGINDAEKIEGTIDNLYELLNDGTAEEIRRMVAALRDCGNEMSTECKIAGGEDGGEERYAISHGKCVDLSGGRRVLVFSLTDITRQKEEEASLITLSETDSLTKISNRLSGERRVNMAIRDGSLGMFCLFDINKFKYVNDTFGHSVGDEVLVAVANTMKKTFRATDVLIRLGGDEFVVYASDIFDIPTAKSVINRFLANIGKIDLPNLNGHHISVSLGAVLVTEEMTFADAYASTDSVMYECKVMGGNAYKILGE